MEIKNRNYENQKTVFALRQKRLFPSVTVEWRRKNMRHKIGILMVLFGVLLLISPGMFNESFSSQLRYSVMRYWPILLVAFGVFLSSGAKVKRKKR